MKSVQRCTRCVMDNSSDNTITFDEKGQCNYCTDALKKKETTYFPGAEGHERLNTMLDQIKADGKDKPYDCLMGISGGLDSSYLAYLGHKWGLRILAVHIDDGFDTEISKKNIERLCAAADITLHTIRPDPVQYNDLTLAYMKAGVANLAVPQDNILFAFLYDTLSNFKIKYFLTGGNFALECILQQYPSYTAVDLVNLRDIHKKYGTQPVDKLKFISEYQLLMMRKKSKAVTLRLLDCIDYNRELAFQQLKEFCGFEYYGAKHLENILTAFIQLYWFPEKFGVDKRTSHLSSMIVSGQMTRDEAIAQLEHPRYDEALMDSYISIIKAKLGLTDSEFEALMQQPPKQHSDYKTELLIPQLRKFKHFIQWRIR